MMEEISHVLTAQERYELNRERILETIKDPEEEGRVGRGAAFFCVGTRFLATGEIPPRKNIELLFDAVDLTLRQGSGGYDSLADKRAQAGGDFPELIKTYWPDEMKIRYLRVLERVNEDFPKGTKPTEREYIRDRLKNWFNTFSYWEAITREVEPHPNLRPDPRGMERDEDGFILGVNVAYRESTNHAYAELLAAIMDPTDQEENKKLVEEVIFPTLMIYQIATDFGQIDLESQKSKPTMNKANPRLLEDTKEQRSIFKKVKRSIETSQECFDTMRPYATMLRIRDLPKSLDFMKQPLDKINPRTREGMISLFNMVIFWMDTTKYSILGEQKGRWEMEGVA